MSAGVSSTYRSILPCHSGETLLDEYGVCVRVCRCLILCEKYCFTVYTDSKFSLISVQIEGMCLWLGCQKKSRPSYRGPTCTREYAAECHRVPSIMKYPKGTYLISQYQEVKSWHCVHGVYCAGWCNLHRVRCACWKVFAQMYLRIHLYLRTRCVLCRMV